MDPPSAADALAYYEQYRGNYLRDLMALVGIPSISFPGFPTEPLRNCADTVASLMRSCGLQDVRIIGGGKGYPSVFGQFLKAPGRPTLLLYAHYDVQPVGTESLWTTPPFSPSVREGRLFGRGTADDKGGIMMHLAAIGSYLRGGVPLPLNIKVLIEGEEEIGSTNLGRILADHHHLLAADGVVIADSENIDTGTPSLTASLRGIVTVTVEVRSLSASVHSGTWGGPLPDPVLALSRMLAGLVDDQGIPAVPGLMDRVRPLTAKERSDLAAIPFRENVYRAQAKLLDSVEVIGGSGTVHEKMWYRPSIAVNAFEASSRKQASNIVNDHAWARVGVRIVPDMDPAETLALLKDYFVKHAPWGVHVEIAQESPSYWWHTDPQGPLFDAALASLEAGYGRPPVIVGAGGSIPFVRTITDALGGVPALLVGVGDPYAASHSENESLVIADWESACRSLIHLFSRAGRLMDWKTGCRKEG